MNFTGLPDIPAIQELQTIPQWVAWKLEERNGKMTKPPVAPRSGFGASHSDPKTWGSYQEAAQMAARRKLAGVGFVLSPQDEYTGIDLDKCITEEGKLEPWAAEIVSLAETYCEVSPSGRGLRLIARGKVDRAIKNDQAHVEIYRDSRYLTITGNHVDGTPSDIRPAPRTIEKLAARVEAMRPAPEPRHEAPSIQTHHEWGSAGSEEVWELVSHIPADCGYHQWIETLMAIHSATGGSSEGLGIADAWSARGGSKYPGTREIEKKWNSFKRGGVTIRTLAHLARQYGANLGEIAARHNRIEGYDPIEAAEAARRLVESFTKKEIDKAASELEWFDEIAPVIDTPYLVKGVIDRGAMSVVYGASNSGKTFFALDLAFHIAIGQQWRDRRVSVASVLYLAAEGGNGIANRIVALRGEYGVCDVPLALRRAGLDLLKNAADTANVVALAREVSKRGPIGLIVIDTLSRVIAGGDENAATDMTAFIRNVDMIRQQTGAHIMVVHHTGKDAAKGARGHSSLRAATDTEIEISIDEAGNRFANTTKQRDHTGGETWCFKLKPIELGEDTDGDTVSTCVVESILPQEQPKDALPPRAVCQKILDDIRAAWNAKNPYSMTGQSQRTGRYAPRALSKRHNVKEAVTYKLLLAWLDNDVIRSEVFEPRKNRSGLQVVGSI
jgi:primase-polymerase (primpol)-like protein